MTNRHSEKDADVGEYMTELQIRARRRGIENEIATQHADSCIEKCKSLKGIWMAYNSFLDDWTYLFSAKIITSSNERIWDEVSEHYDTVNVWEQHHMQCKARRAYAAFKKVHMDTVTVEEVEQTQLGIKGWADVVHTVSATNVDVKSDNKQAKAKKLDLPVAKKTTVATPSDSISSAEKVAKQLISQELVLETQYKSITQQVAISAESWSWADTFLEDLRSKRSEFELFLEGLGDSFYDKLKAAALSPNLMKGLRKETGTHWHSKLCAFIEGAEKRLEEIDYCCKNIQNMNHAKNHPFETPKKAKKTRSTEKTK